MSKKKTQQSSAEKAAQQNVVHDAPAYDDRTLLLNSGKKGQTPDAGNVPSAPKTQGKGVKKYFGLFVKYPRSIIYGLGFVLLAIFCIWTYGPVFHHIALDDFVCSDAEAMSFVRRMRYGTIYWGARYVLLVYKSQWLGGILMAALLTLTAWLFDRLLVLATAKSQRFSGIGMGLGFLPVGGVLYYMVHRGYNLFFRCEISTFVIWTLALFALALVVGLVGFVLRRFVVKGSAPTTLWAYAGFVLVLCGYGYLTKKAVVDQQNVRVSCQMQNILDETEDWEKMAELARSCKQPSRSVAAFYAISLVQQDQLIEHVFDIRYDYPDIELDDVGGNDEGINYIADCNLYAGLVTAAYHTSMENHVMVGPRLRNYKRMAVCAILNGEYPLARRYLRIISKVPFEKKWVERHEAMIKDPKQIDDYERYAKIKKLAPREFHFEQWYRQPVFLGFNVGVQNGSSETLVTSVAACMYSKDLDNLLQRTDFLSKMTTMPLQVHQCLLIASNKRPGLLDKYPQINGILAPLRSEYNSFIQDAKPYIERKKEAGNDEAKVKAIQNEMAEALRERWLGTYYYYYYCGNLNQTVKKSEGHGVN